MSLLERRLRVFSGVVMAAYVIPHFLNHSLGIFSFDALEAGRETVRLFWHLQPIQLLLYTSFFIHAALALASLYRRNTLRMPPWEAIQLVFGLLIPPLLAIHVIGTSVVNTIGDVEPYYDYVVAAQWANPRILIQQPLLLIVVWIHVCVGLHFWLRLRDWYLKSMPIWLVLAFMIPTLALLGFANAGLDISAAIQDADVFEEVFSDWLLLEEETRAFILGLEFKAWLTMAAVLSMVLLARWVKQARLRRSGVFEVSHANGRTASGLAGQTLLEALRLAGIKHASVCGGRARCTTCRIRVTSEINVLPEPNELERTALVRIKAGEGVRLACQLKPVNDIAITPLIRPDIAATQLKELGGVQGHERQVVAMFLDLRDSTRLGEERLPYDVLFILNQFFAEMSRALRESNGHYAQFAGDGLMALYGLESGFKQGCEDALDGATKMLQRLQELNQRLAGELPNELRIGIGIHGGEAIVGTMGPPSSPNYSAIGDNINIAARLEAKSKEFACQVVVSETVMRGAGIELGENAYQAVDVRGREGLLSATTIADLESLLGVCSNIGR